MKKATLLAFVLSVAVVSYASAAPMMLGSGHKSLSFQADSSSPSINFGWNAGELTRVHFGGGWTSMEPSAPEGVTVDSETTWNFNVGASRYMDGIATDSFAPFIGGRFLVNGAGDAIRGGDSISFDPSFGFEGFFGVEAFVVDALSVGGNVGIGFVQQGDETNNTNDPPTVEKGGNTVGTRSSAVMATLWW